MIINDPTRQLPLLLLISFDGFRHDYLSPTLTPNLFDLSKRATLGHMESLYITKTFPNHFSMVTGLYEDEHEVINNKMFDPKLNETFNLATTDVKWWDPKGNKLPIWTANQLSGPKLGQKRISASMMFPGSTVSFRGIQPRYFKEYDRVRNWTKNVDTVIEWMTKPDEPANFVAMYFDDPDDVAHNHGPWGQETLDSLRGVDSAAGYLIKRLRDVQLANRANIIFVSDHGMSEVKQNIYLNELAINVNRFEMYGNSPDWSIFVKPEYNHLRETIFEELRAASVKGRYKIYKREDVAIDRHYSKSKRIGDFFLITNEFFDLYKTIAEATPRTKSVWGNHGWKPENREMRPLFMAYGPSFKQDYYHNEPFPNIDLFPLMGLLLELPLDRMPNNGSLERIIDIVEFSSMNKAVEALKLAYIALIGLMMFILSSIIFMLFIRTSKPKLKNGVDFDDLSPGLNIDLGYYTNNCPVDTKREEKKKNKEERYALLNSPYY